MQALVLGPVEAHLCCYTCGGIATVTGAGDPVADRAAWPDMECPFTLGCRGRLVPEVLN